MTLSGGVTLHLDNLPSWYRKLSPMEWTLSSLLPQVHNNTNKTNCRQQVQRQDIIVQAPCETTNDSALREIGLDKAIVDSNFQLAIGIGIVCLLIIIGFFIIRYNTQKRPRSAPNKP